MLLDTPKLLKENGLSPNKYRISILGYLKEFMNHPSAEQVFEHIKIAFPQVSYATVYNNLNIFVEKKMANSFVDENRVMRFDGNTSSHDHFHCERCGQIYDIPNQGQSDQMIEGHRIKSRAITYSGVCVKCQRENSF